VYGTATTRDLAPEGDTRGIECHPRLHQVATDVNTPTPGANWQIDGAESYASASQEYDRVEGESPFDIPRSITGSAWIKVTSFTQNWQAIVTKGDSGSGPSTTTRPPFPPSPP